MRSIHDAKRDIAFLLKDSWLQAEKEQIRPTGRLNVDVTLHLDNSLLGRLRHLNLSRNPMGSPLDISRMPNLRALILERTQITTWREGLFARQCRTALITGFTRPSMTDDKN